MINGSTDVGFALYNIKTFTHTDSRGFSSLHLITEERQRWKSFVFI